MKRILICLSLVVSFALSGFAQGTRVTGTVTDAMDGSSLPGVTVAVEGTTQGTVTDANGRYELTVAPDAVLVFSFIGMITERVPVEGQTVVNVVMSSDIATLEEFVVTAVGIERTRRSLGYSVSEVDAELAIQRAEPDALRALEGRIPGVDISGSSGAAGSATRITIRGQSSFLGGNQPLFVVDGIPYSNTQVTTSNQLTGSGGAYGTSFSTLDPNDIESINVLKGAAAAAIYGSRAANGAVIITTKSGSRDRRPSQRGMEVTFRSSMAWEQIANLPNFQNRYGAGVDFVAQNVNGSWGAPFAEVDSLVTWPFGYREAYPELFGERVPYRAYPNNVKDLFNTGQILENSINVRSVSDRGMYNLTVSRTDQEGYIPHSGFERTSFSIGGNQRLENGLRVGGTVSYSRSIQDGGRFGQNQFGGAASSFARVLVAARNWDMVGLPYETPDGDNLMFVGTGQADHPRWSWRYNTINTQMDRSVANMNFGYDILDWLQVDYSFGINHFEQKRNEYINPGSRAAEQLGRITEDHYTNQEIESNLLFTAYRAINQDLNIKGVLGHNVNQRTFTRYAVVGERVITRGIKNVGNTEEQLDVTPGNAWSRQRLWAVFADVSLEFRNYLFLNLTGRNDFSSTLPEDNRSFFYPAVATSFVFTDAFDLQNDILTEGKIRASWAQVGNDAGPYFAAGYFNVGNPWLGNNTMAVPTTGFDPELTPEFTNEIELGTELEFLNGRIGVDFAWYDRRTTDQIAPVSLPASSGINLYYTNFGEMQNTGIELGLSLVPVQLENSLRWEIFTTFTRNQSEVLSLTEGVERINFTTGAAGLTGVLEVGQPYGVLRGSVAARDDQGNYLINPQSGKIIEAVDLGYLGDPAPDWRSSITNTLSYRGITLGVVFDISMGGSLYSNTIEGLLGRGVTKDTEDREGTRIIPGVLGNADTQQPLLDANGNTIPNYVQVSENSLWFGESFAINTMDEMSVYDATVYRLREVSLNFEMPRRWFENNLIGGASIGFVGRNLWYHAPNVPEHTNFDPTLNTFGATNIQGIEHDAAPTTRRYAVNLRVNF